MSVTSQADVQSPPWNDRGPFSAGRSSRAMTPPPQAVAPVTGVSVRGGRFNNSASANNNFSLSLFNLVLGPRDNSAPSGVQSEFPSSTYSRLLLPKACGFPLYDPQPPGRLNSEYRSEGVRIGDVGIITTEGNFDFLFNICHSADHPINRGGVPHGFSPPQWATDIVFTPENCRDPGDYLMNGSIQAIESDRTSGDYHFKGSPGEAAVLVIPTPTIKAHATNTRDFRDYAAENAVAWYQFGTEGLRRDIPNGSIYLITGWEKTQSWGTASFEGNKHDFEMAYRNKIWAQYGSATAKRGPRDAGVPHPAPCNQCIFLSGYKTMLGESLWDRVLGTVKVSAVGSTATMASSSGSGSSMGTGASLAGSLARWFYPSGQNQGGSAGQPGLGIEQNESNAVVLESINPATSEDVHPSNLINCFLLDRVPEADVAITHDDVWCSLVKEPHLPFQDQIESLYIINNRNGAVYLTKKPRFATDSEGAISVTSLRPSAHQLQDNNRMSGAPSFLARPSQSLPSPRTQFSPRAMSSSSARETTLTSTPPPLRLPPLPPPTSSIASSDSSPLLTARDSLFSDSPAHTEITLPSIEEHYDPGPAPSASPSLQHRPSKRVKKKIAANPAVLAPAPKLSFEPVMVDFKSLPLEAFLWTLDNQELQKLVSQAIRTSARESFVRLLSLDNLERAIPEEIERLEALKAQTQANYRFMTMKRTMLLQALNQSSATGEIKVGEDGISSGSNLAKQLSETCAECDKALETVVKTADQILQLQKLVDVHWASALAIALRKLNMSYAERTEELMTTRERVANLEAELEEAWDQAAKHAEEMDDVEMENNFISDEESEAGDIEVEEFEDEEIPPPPPPPPPTTTATTTTQAPDTGKAHDLSDIDSELDEAEVAVIEKAEVVALTPSRRASTISDTVLRQGTKSFTPQVPPPLPLNHLPEFTAVSPMPHLSGIGKSPQSSAALNARGSPVSTVTSSSQPPSMPPRSPLPPAPLPRDPAHYSKHNQRASDVTGIRSTRCTKSTKSNARSIRSARQSQGSGLLSPGSRPGSRLGSRLTSALTDNGSINGTRLRQVSAARSRSQRASKGSLRIPRTPGSAYVDQPPVPDLPPEFMAATSALITSSTPVLANTAALAMAGEGMPIQDDVLSPGAKISRIRRTSLDMGNWSGVQRAKTVGAQRTGQSLLGSTGEGAKPSRAVDDINFRPVFVGEIQSKNPKRPSRPVPEVLERLNPSTSGREEKIFRSKAKAKQAEGSSKGKQAAPAGEEDSSCFSEEHVNVNHISGEGVNVLPQVKFDSEDPRLRMALEALRRPGIWRPGPPGTPRKYRKEFEAGIKDVK